MALLFSEGHFPVVASPSDEVRDAIAAIARDCKLESDHDPRLPFGGAWVVRACSCEFYEGGCFSMCWETTWLTPTWDPGEPDALLSVIERYKVPGADLLAAGYDAIEAGAQYWFQRRWDRDEETWFIPQQVGSLSTDGKQIRSGRFSMGSVFVPLVWIRNPSGRDCAGWRLYVQGGCRDEYRDRLPVKSGWTWSEVFVGSDATDQGAGGARRRTGAQRGQRVGRQ